ncbi:MAG: ribosome-associated translation inhibitor RaiA [Actinomycetota bacterium]|nr:ribosome-associated translation inhibitor RaiA [Actinomycetota bacterium]
MNIEVTGRDVEVPEHYQVHVAEKMARLERYDHKIVRYEVQLSHENNPRQSKICQRVEITGTGKCPLVRAEASGPDFYAALAAALAKLDAQLRRNHDRRRVHHGLRQPTSVAEATADLETTADLPDHQLDVPTDGELDGAGHEDDDPGSGWVSTDIEGPGRIVRQKEHTADPMTVDQAVCEMELIGHDFYLFVDAERGQPSVVYRRRGFDYGVIRLV